MTSDPNSQEAEHKKDLRIRFLEEQAKWNLFVSELLISAEDLHHKACLERDPHQLLESTAKTIEKLMEFQGIAFYLVNEADSEFVLSQCHPEKFRSKLERAVDLQVENGTFAWGVYLNKPVLTKPGWPGQTLVMHALATEKRVRGMFAALVEGDLTELTEQVYYPLSIVLKNTAKGLESIALYDLLFKNNANLETKVKDRTKELKIQSVQLEEEAAFRRVAENTLEVAKEQVEKALKSKDDFLHNIGHEMRTPLNAILGYSEMLQYEFEQMGRPEFVEDLQAIESSGRHLLSVVNDVLDLVKIQAGKMDIQVETFDVANLIEAVMITVQPLGEKEQNHLLWKAENDLGTMESDPIRLRQILLNLLSNACKYTRNGTVTLQARRSSTGGFDILEFAVTDTGSGMDPETMKALFDSLNQGGTPPVRKFEGSGLGLPISKRLCQLLGGRIHGVSELGKGTTFTVRLPAHLDAETLHEGVSPALLATIEAPEPQLAHPGLSGFADPRGRVVAEEAPAPQKNASILVMEEDPLLRNLLCSFLEKEGFQTYMAFMSETLVEKVGKVNPQALVIGKVEGEMDSWELIEALGDYVRHGLMVVKIEEKGGAVPAALASRVKVFHKPLDWDVFLAAMNPLKKARDKPHVLIVQSDPVNREFLSRVFHREGWGVNLAPKGRPGIDLIKQVQPALVIVDLLIGIVETFDLLAELKKRDNLRSVPVILLTARDLSPDEEKLLEGQVRAILKKGHFSRSDLLDQVHRLASV
ncbi:MAG: ATP-binding protein [Nitrospinaceae bacterium]